MDVCLAEGAKTGPPDLGMLNPSFDRGKFFSQLIFKVSDLLCLLSYHLEIINIFGNHMNKCEKYLFLQRFLFQWQEVRLMIRWV